MSALLPSKRSNNRLWIALGRVLYLPAWPALYIYLRYGGERTRIIVTSNDKILLVRDWLGDGSWSLPGGGLHRGEVANIGALRELKEETGLQVDPLQLILLDKMVLRGQGFRILVSCFCLNLSDDLFVQPSGREILDVGWFSVDKTLTKLNISSSTRQLIEKWRKQL